MQWLRVFSNLVPIGVVIVCTLGDVLELSLCRDDWCGVQCGTVRVGVGNERAGSTRTPT
jgi:hypothetical protein